MKADKRKGKKFDIGGPTSYSGEDTGQGMKMSTRRGGDSGEMSFKQAFAAARKAGDSTFTWQGKKYTTEMAGAKKSEPAKVVETKTETKVETPPVSGPRSGGRGSKPASVKVGTGRYDDPTSSYGERVFSPLRKLTDIFGRREEERVMRNMSVDRDEARKRLDAVKAVREREGMRRGGSVKKYAGGGSVSSASKRADGIASKGKTRGKFV